MQTWKYEGDLYNLSRWALNRTSREREELPEPYRSWVIELLPENCRETVAAWVGFSTPYSPLDGDWILGYPHTHVISRSWPEESTTVITYLTAPEEGGEFGMGGKNKDDPYEFVMPEPGLTVKCDATIWHGVKPVIKGTRLALITTGFPI